MKNPTIYNATEEFSKILQNYMEFFGLEAIDIAFLASSTRKNVENVINLKGSLELNTVEAISQIFNLHYYQFANPRQKIPNKQSLPPNTLNRISYRESKGAYIQESYNATNLISKITIVLSFFETDYEFITEEIVDKINLIDADDNFNTSIIGDRLEKSFQKNIINTKKKMTTKSGRGRKPLYFKLISPIKQEELEKAVLEVEEYWLKKCKELFADK